MRESWDRIYADPEHPDRWIRERHIESSENHYVLRFASSTNSSEVFAQFTDSFEIEKNSDFQR